LAPSAVVEAALSAPSSAATLGPVVFVVVVFATLCCCELCVVRRAACGFDLLLFFKYKEKQRTAT
jgi:hypothetical protein